MLVESLESRRLSPTSEEQKKSRHNTARPAYCPTTKIANMGHSRARPTDPSSGECPRRACVENCSFCVPIPAATGGGSHELYNYTCGSPLAVVCRKFATNRYFTLEKAARQPQLWHGFDQCLLVNHAIWYAERFVLNSQQEAPWTNVVFKDLVMSSYCPCLRRLQLRSYLLSEARCSCCRTQLSLFSAARQVWPGTVFV